MTQYFSFALNFPPEIDPFPADFAGHAIALISREFFGGQVHSDPLGGEKIVVGNLSIRQHLLLIFVGNFRMHLPREPYAFGTVGRNRRSITWPILKKIRW